MATFADGTFKPDVDLQADDSLRVQVSRYGDGYQQTTLDGANSLETSFRVTFSNRPRFEIMQMRNYLRQMAANAFPFFDPATGETTIVQCVEWSIQWAAVRPGTSDAFGTLSATFTKFNGLYVQ